jgi:hypothetical protein
MKIKRVFFVSLIMFLIPVLVLYSQAVDTREIDKVRDKPVLDSKDLQVIDDFLAQAINELIRTRDFTSIARTRTVILSNQSSQAQYAKQFSASAYKYISSGFQRAQDLPQERQFKVILNLLILVNELSDPHLADLAIAKLKDNNTAIRYWAVRCVTNPDLIKKLNSAKGANPTTAPLSSFVRQERGEDPNVPGLARRIAEQLKQLVDCSEPAVIALIAEFASVVDIPEGEDLLIQIADTRIKQYADWTVQYELLDSNLLRLLYNKIASTSSSKKPELARCFAQLYSYAMQRYIKGQNLSNNDKQYLASVLVDTEDKCIGKILGKTQSTIRKAVEQNNISALQQEYDRLFGSPSQAGELTLKLNIDYGTDDSSGRKIIAPLPLPNPPGPKQTPSPVRDGQAHETGG